MEIQDQNHKLCSHFSVNCVYTLSGHAGVTMSVLLAGDAMPKTDRHIAHGHLTKYVKGLPEIGRPIIGEEQTSPHCLPGGGGRYRPISSRPPCEAVFWRG